MSTPNRRDKWKARVQRDRKLSAQARLFLVATLAPKMYADGTVSHPRSKLAAIAGVSQRQVSTYIKDARDAGWLVVVSPGYRTMTAVYQATFPDVKEGSDDFSLSEPESGKYKGTHSGGSDDFPHSPEESGKSSLPTTSSTTTRRLRVVGADRNVSHLPRSPLSRRRAFGFGINESQRDRRTLCRTQPRTVKRHRPDTSVTAQVERHPSGTDPATRFVFYSTRPQRKAQR